MLICDLFDRYRDNELGINEREGFESHLAACEECRAKTLLLDKVVLLLKNEEVRPLNLADQIARKAFESKSSWASAVVSWLRPMPAVAALLLVGVLLSSIWLMTGSRPASAYAEFEKLMEEADVGQIHTLSQSAQSQAHSDNDLMLWLEQEGDSQ
jgi:anti-sigma factor RsiW